MTRHRKTARRASGGSGGFTLIELLVTITIIAILAGVVLVSVEASRQAARETRTRTLIARIDRYLIVQYESYRSRRLPMSSTDLYGAAVYHGWIDDGQAASSLVIRRARLNAIRDLMRMEMPDRWSDVTGPLTSGPLVLWEYTRKEDPPPVEWQRTTSLIPAVTRRYYRAYDNAEFSPRPENRDAWGSAECLYQIVMNIPGAKDDFRDRDVGDIDEDGLKEFHDGWGRPIQYIRWPAGFVNYGNLTDHNQIDFTDGTQPPAGRATGPALSWSDPSEIQNGNPEEQPDQFDASRVMARLVQRWVDTDGDEGLPPTNLGYTLYPLIYSAGPDGRPDINIGTTRDGAGNLSTYEYVLTADNDLNPFAPDGNDAADADGNERRYIGQPLDSGQIDLPGVVDEEHNDNLDHYDNIHNHSLQAR